MSGCCVGQRSSTSPGVVQRDLITFCRFHSPYVYPRPTVFPPLVSYPCFVEYLPKTGTVLIPHRTLYAFGQVYSCPTCRASPMMTP